MFYRFIHIFKICTYTHTKPSSGERGTSQDAHRRRIKVSTQSHVMGYYSMPSFEKFEFIVRKLYCILKFVEKSAPGAPLLPPFDKKKKIIMFNAITRVKKA